MYNAFSVWGVALAICTLVVLIWDMIIYSRRDDASYEDLQEVRYKYWVFKGFGIFFSLFTLAVELEARLHSQSTLSLFILHYSHFTIQFSLFTSFTA